jgi:hypothetical protein
MNSERTQDATMEAGRALDAKVCKALGIAGTVQYFASDNGGETGYLFSHYRREVEDFIADYRQLLPGSGPAGCEVCESVVYPRVSEDIVVAWLVVEEAVRRGMPASVSVSMGWGGAPNGYNASWCGAFAHADTAPLAICLAALDALASTVPLAPGDPS